MRQFSVNWECLQLQNNTVCVCSSYSSTCSSLFVWGWGMGMLHVQQHTSSVFYPLVYLIYKAAKEWVGEWLAEWLQTTKLFHTVLCAKPCDNRVTEKPSTFSRARPYLVAPRPGLEPGTYRLTESQARKKPL